MSQLNLNIWSVTHCLFLDQSFVLIWPYLMTCFGWLRIIQFFGSVHVRCLSIVLIISLAIPSNIYVKWAMALTILYKYKVGYELLTKQVRLLCCNRQLMTTSWFLRVLSLSCPWVGLLPTHFPVDPVITQVLSVLSCPTQISWKKNLSVNNLKPLVILLSAWIKNMSTSFHTQNI